MKVAPIACASVRIGDSGELFQEQAAGVAMDQRDVVMAAEQAHDLLGSPSRNRPVSTKMQVKASPIASCTSAAATAESTPRGQPQTTAAALNLRANAPIAWARNAAIVQSPRQPATW